MTNDNNKRNRKPKRTAMHDALNKAAYAGKMGEFFKAYPQYGKTEF